MAESIELQKAVIAALNEKIPNAVCPLCKVQDWNVQLGTSFLPLKIETGNTSSWNSNALPVALLICGNCGNTHLLNLEVLLPK